MKLYGIFFVLFNLICTTISAAPVETDNVKNNVAVNDVAVNNVAVNDVAGNDIAVNNLAVNNVAVNDPALLRSHHDRVIATASKAAFAPAGKAAFATSGNAAFVTAGKAAFDEDFSKARSKKKITQHTVSALDKSLAKRKETFAKYYQYLTTDIFHPHAIAPELYLSRLSIHQLISEDVLPEIIIPLNNDLRRLRIAANTKAIPAAPLQIVPLRPLVDATTFQTSASYHFSSTDFHPYLFRLKPF